MLTFALVPWNASVTIDELTLVAGAISLQVARDVLPAWQLVAPVSAYTDASCAPASSIKVFVTDDVNGRSGIHYHAESDTTFALVQYAGGRRWSAAASHEVVEHLIDPSLQRLVAPRHVDDPIRQGKYLLAACKPCQSFRYAYPVDSSQDIYVSDFCLPAYFELNGEPSAPFSFGDNLAGPWTVADGGSLTWIDESGRFCQLSASGGKSEIAGPFSPEQVFARTRSRRNLRGIIDRSLMLASRFTGSESARRPKARKDSMSVAELRRLNQRRGALLEGYVQSLLEKPHSTIRSTSSTATSSSRRS